jgi:hypothetical protein
MLSVKLGYDPNVATRLVAYGITEHSQRFCLAGLRRDRAAAYQFEIAPLSD